MQHKTWLELNSANLRSNIQMLGSLLSSGVVFCAVVKANAYGHDLETMARILVLEGINTFAVDSVDEAMKLRAHHPNITIFILGFTVPERFKDVIKGGFIQTVTELETIHKLAQAALDLQTKAKINLKVETGTQRQGINSEKIRDFAFEIEKMKDDIEFVGLSSHFANSEDVRNPDFCLTQNQIFFNTAKELDIYKVQQPHFYHISCSASAISQPTTQFNMVRIGLALYGLWSSEELRRQNLSTSRHVDLKPVLRWKTRIAPTKDDRAGATVGYGRAFLADRPLRIAVLPVGYYDGYRRLAMNKGYVLVNGQKCRILGKICMNMMMIDVSQVPQAKTGSVVTLLGRDGMNEIKAEDLASWFETINYEAVTGISSHLPRIIT